MANVNLVVDSSVTVSNLTATIGVAGPAGVSGRSVLNGSGIPASATGSDGDFYIDTVAHNLYGPKTSGSWGSATSLVGPAGSGSGDMLASVYDPTSVAADTFSMDNMVEGTTTKIMTDAERTKLSGIAASADVTDATSVAAAGAFMKASDTVDNLTDGTTYVKYSAAEKTKLSGIAASADVTDATSVAAAGAVMTTGGSMTGALDLGANALTSVLDPTAAQDAATKNYVDSTVAAAGGGDVTGPTSSTTNDIALFADTSGKVLKDGTGLTYDSSTGIVNRTGGLILETDSASTATLQSGTAKVEVSQTGGVNVAGWFSARVVPRETTISSASLTPDVSVSDIYHYNILSVDLTINAPTGNPTTGTKLMFAIKDNGTSRNLTWDASFIPIGVTIPTSTTPGKWLYVGAVYNYNASAWHVIAISQEA